MRIRALLMLILASACGTTYQRTYAKVISPEPSGSPTAWTDSELEAPRVIRNLRRTPEASFHLVRVKTELARRMHNASDLSLFVVSGKLELGLGDSTFQVASGDVVEIPRGTPYSARNQRPEGAVLYEVFTPALSAEDTIERPEPLKDNPWKWNLWQQ